MSRSRSSLTSFSAGILRPLRSACRLRRVATTADLRLVLSGLRCPALAGLTGSLPRRGPRLGRGGRLAAGLLHLGAARLLLRRAVEAARASTLPSRPRRPGRRRPLPELDLVDLRPRKQAHVPAGRSARRGRAGSGLPPPSSPATTQVLLEALARLVAAAAALGNQHLLAPGEPFAPGRTGPAASPRRRPLPCRPPGPA